jgi:hypothetical protein
LDIQDTAKEIDKSKRDGNYKKSGREPYQRVIDNINDFTGRRWQ